MALPGPRRRDQSPPVEERARAAGVDSTSHDRPGRAAPRPRAPRRRRPRSLTIRPWERGAPARDRDPDRDRPGSSDRRREADAIRSRPQLASYLHNPGRLRDHPSEARLRTLSALRPARPGTCDASRRRHGHEGDNEIRSPASVAAAVNSWPILLIWSNAGVDIFSVKSSSTRRRSTSGFSTRVQKERGRRTGTECRSCRSDSTP